jgi:putative resolvase
VNSKEVLNLLQISRKTIHVYAMNCRIRYIVMPNKFYDYNEEDVYKILNRDVKRKTVIYERVSTHKQKNDLQYQIDSMKQ